MFIYCTPLHGEMQADRGTGNSLGEKGNEECWWRHTNEEAPPYGKATHYDLCVASLLHCHPGGGDKFERRSCGNSMFHSNLNSVFVPLLRRFRPSGADPSPALWAAPFSKGARAYRYPQWVRLSLSMQALREGPRQRRRMDAAEPRDLNSLSSTLNPVFITPS